MPGAAPVKPIAAPPPQWNTQAQATSDWPSPEWWRGFGSAELESLIADAQTHNMDISAAEARMRQADAQARIAGAPLLPSIGVQPIASSIRSISPAGTIRRYNPLGGVVTASYEIDLWGKLHDSHFAAQESARSAAFATTVVRLGITCAVASTYLRLLAVQDALADAKADAAGADRFLAGMQVQQEHGLVTALQVAQQREVTARLAAEVPPVEAQRAHLLDALAILTGRLPEQIAIRGRSLDDLAVPEVAPGLPSELLFHRPDIQQAEHVLAAAGANIEVARKSFLPSIGLTGSGGVESVALSSAIVGPTAIFGVGLSMLQPIFAGGRLRGNLDLANARYAELAADYLRTVQQAYGDTEDALADVSAGNIEVGKRQEALAAAQSALDMARRSFSAGTTDALTLITAEQALSTAHSEMSRSRLDKALATISLYKALGGGWVAPGSR